MTAQGQVTNGGFSSATFSGWTLLGNPTIDTANPPMGAAAAAVISSTNTLDPDDAVDYTTIQNSLDLILPSTNVGTEPPINGEAIYQTITLSAPAQLTFQFQMTAQDLRILTTDQVGYSLTNLADVANNIPDPGVFYSLNAAQTPNTYTSVTSATIAPGSYILGFIAYNTADNHGLTSFEVSEIEVPEPATWMLMAGGLAILAALFRPLRQAVPVAR